MALGVVVIAVAMVKKHLVRPFSFGWSNCLGYVVHLCHTCRLSGWVEIYEFYV
jgi:hypothetical protein